MAKKRSRLPWVFIIFAAIVIWALVADLWSDNPLWWGLGAAVIVGVITFILVKSPVVRQRVWSGLKYAGSDLWRSLSEEERERRRQRAYIPKRTRNRVEKRADGKCEHPKCHHRLGLWIHHIDHNTENRRYSNLILLCRNHADMADKWQFRKETLERWARQNEARLNAGKRRINQKGGRAT